MGMGSSLSLSPSLERITFSVMPKSDLDAISDDWNATGNDIRSAIAVVAPEASDSKKHVLSQNEQLRLW